MNNITIIVKLKKDTLAQQYSLNISLLVYNMALMVKNKI